MTKLVYHSNTLHDGTPISTVFVWDDGLMFVFNTGDWFEHQGNRVYMGEHLQSDPRLIEKRVAVLRNEPPFPGLTKEILYDALHH